MLKLFTIKLPILTILITLIFSCQQNNQPDYKHPLLNSVLWMQHSAEYKASTNQAYNVAKQMLILGLNDKDWTAAVEQIDNYQSLPPAIILDVDETVLDNSAYESWLIKNNKSYASDTWKDWCEQEHATAIPGAVEFCNYAAKKGVTIFYVTNRRDNVKDVTKSNLQKTGFPIDTKTETVITRSDKSDKGPRRTEISKNYRILLLIGDNGGDFFSDFTHGQQDIRNNLVNRFSENWGTKWIVLPNPMYGDWENALFNYDFKISAEQKNKIKFDRLKN